jgi:hypothetical protein
MRIRRNRPTKRREAFTSLMWYPPTGGELVFLPAYGGAEDEIQFKSSTDEMKVEEVPSRDAAGGPSLADWLGLGKEAFQLINGVWMKVRDSRGQPVQQVVAAPPPTNYTPILLGGLALTVLIIGSVALLRDK